MLQKPDICSSMDGEDDILANIRLSWVDDPNPIHFRNHRASTQYAHELKMLTQVMKDYSQLSYKVNQNLLDQTLKYGLNAYTIFNNALHQWLENNAEAHTAPIVCKLVKEYEERGSKDLVRYHSRPSKTLEERLVATVSTATSLGSHLSQESIKIIKDQMQKIQKLEIQTKVKELALEEKNIEIRKKELELESYKNLVDGFENITEASDLASCWPITSEINLYPTTRTARQSSEKINMGNLYGSKQDIKRTKIPEVEIPCPRLPVSEKEPALGVADWFSQPVARNKEDMQPTMWAMMPKGLLEDKGICFTGKDVSEYPPYRHRFLTNDKEYRYSRPDILLC